MGGFAVWLVMPSFPCRAAWTEGGCKIRKGREVHSIEYTCRSPWFTKVIIAWLNAEAEAEAETPILWPPDAKNWLIGNDPDAGKDWRQEKKGTTEDEVVGWHHWLDGHEFEQVLGIGDGQGSLACCSPWGRKESDTTERLNWTELKWSHWCLHFVTCHNHLRIGDFQILICAPGAFPSVLFFFFFFLKEENIYLFLILFIWLHWVFVIPFRIWFPEQGSNLSLLHWELEVLAILDHQGSPSMCYFGSLQLQFKISIFILSQKMEIMSLKNTKGNSMEPGSSKVDIWI